MKNYKTITTGKHADFYKEKFYSIQTNIQFLLKKQNIRNILITSSNMGEGKSLTSANTALAFSDRGYKVLLIDADLHRPSLKKYFGRRGMTGLMDYFDGMPLVDAVDHLEDTRVDLLMTGVLPPNPTEWLDSDEMTQLLKEAQAMYDLVIIDAPPLLPITDSRLLSAKCDAVLFVALNKKTKKGEVIQAKKYLEMAEANVIGTILNGVETTNKNREGYYYK
ncbi:CpsD/CapB family tyrosine-protein kinase [Listeria booriae]|uniref:CpsD/CapB family tyrosine-protein kinase n=1 Tax=Listeria booriae TaxID=1552123 RepID=A0A7X0Z319_9LIST|nr:CpsD/CapB family tyrosine-protein kinase [Listeria booriae]MBC2175056.1 CpsD/CapB family tyrosine-protein kinase [Listeria booriae]